MSQSDLIVYRPRTTEPDWILMPNPENSHNPELTVTGNDLDAAVDLIWSDISELINAIQTGAGDNEIFDAKEHISWSLIEYGNLCHLRGEQSK